MHTRGPGSVTQDMASLGSPPAGEGEVRGSRLLRVGSDWIDIASFVRTLSESVRQLEADAHADRQSLRTMMDFVEESMPIQDAHDLLHDLEDKFTAQIGDVAGGAEPTETTTKLIRRLDKLEAENIKLRHQRKAGEAERVAMLKAVEKCTRRQEELSGELVKQALEHKSSRDQAKGLFSDMDMNGDGEISADEFADGFTRALFQAIDADGT